ncbi:MAG TPA: 23S rRNA (uracil(1939)-C(5))-methyltransferase RlmD [Bacteroidales bacterium]|nr:23S rRNA (uracil(1939)-C(5))-methyltransferase RlmD [Bacteroidales bacterium]
MGRKKELPALSGVTITDIGSEGKAIAKVDDMVLFVPGMIPGDVVDVRVTKKKRRYMEGVALKVVTPSPYRVKPECRHFGVCGGCRWQHLAYDKQLFYKAKQVTDNLTRIGHVSVGQVDPILGSEKIYGYRNKLEFTFSGKRWMTREEIGFGVVASGSAPGPGLATGSGLAPGSGPVFDISPGTGSDLAFGSDSTSGSALAPGPGLVPDPALTSASNSWPTPDTGLILSPGSGPGNHAGHSPVLATGSSNAPGPGLGFHIPGIFDKVLDINECLLMSEPADAIRNEVRRYALERKLPFYDFREHKGFLRNIIVRKSSTGEVMIVLVTTDALPEERDFLLRFLTERFPEITSLYSIINTKRNDSISDLQPVHVAGNMFITEMMDGLRFRVGPKSFYQTNSSQAVRLYGIVKEFAQLTGTENVYDLYTGTGTIACYLASQAAGVTGIEYIAEAVADARVNAAENGISNTFFIAGDIKDILTDELFRKRGNPDVIITDPPRAGMHADVVNAMLRSDADRIVYVSCNPATQARDIKILSELYDVVRIAPVDMFPHTFHVENVALLVKKLQKKLRFNSPPTAD